MNRVLFALLLFTFAVVPTFSQTNNHLSKAPSSAAPEVQLPSIRGVKLGMTADELLTVFHAANDIKGQLPKANGYPHFGLLQVTLEPGDEAARERLKGISGCWVHFFDGHISSISVTYSSFPQGADWNDVDGLITKFSETFGLPDASKWEVDPNDSQIKLFKGRGFSVRVTIAGGGSIEIRDTAIDAQAQVKDRAAAYHEERRRAFKP